MGDSPGPANWTRTERGGGLANKILPPLFLKFICRSRRKCILHFMNELTMSQVLWGPFVASDHLGVPPTTFNDQQRPTDNFNYSSTGIVSNLALVPVRERSGTARLTRGYGTEGE